MFYFMGCLFLEVQNKHEPALKSKRCTLKRCISVYFRTVFWWKKLENSMEREGGFSTYLLLLLNWHEESKKPCSFHEVLIKWTSTWCSKCTCVSFLWLQFSSPVIFKHCKNTGLLLLQLSFLVLGQFLFPPPKPMGVLMTSLKGWHVNLKKQQCRALDLSVRKIAPVSGTALRNADWMGSQQELWHQ